MELYLKGCSAVMIGILLSLIVGNGKKEFGLLLSIAVCTMITLCALSYLKPVIGFMQELQRLGNLDPAVMEVLWKTVGIGVLTEVSVLICNDAGNASMGKTLQYLGISVILWLSLPLFSMMIELLQRIMENV